jgi:gluconate 2-dehydrogenase gamma chain
MGHPGEIGVSCWTFFALGVSTTMAGQNVERREVLRVLAIAAAAAPFTGFSKWAFGCGHLSHATTQIRPAVYKPLFFTASEFADVDRLTDIIIPADETPGAREAGVAEFIDFMVSHDPAVQYKFRTGLTWLNAHSEALHGKSFGKLASAQQTAVLEPLAFKAKNRVGDEDGREFFRLMREYAVMGYYTSEIGFKQLDNPALKFYAESPECPHKDDPEHRNLKPATA